MGEGEVKKPDVKEAAPVVPAMTPAVSATDVQDAGNTALKKAGDRIEAIVDDNTVVDSSPKAEALSVDASAKPSADHTPEAVAKKPKKKADIKKLRVLIDYLFGDFFGELIRGPRGAMVKLFKLFGKEDDKASAARKLVEKERDALAKQYKVVVAELIGSGVLPNGVTVKPTDVALLKGDDYKITDVKSLRAFFKDKPAKNISGTVGLVQYIDMADAQEPEVAKKPKVSTSTGAASNPAVAPSVDGAVSAPAEPTPPPKRFSRLPKKSVDMTSGNMCSIGLGSGETVTLDNRYLFIGPGQKKFKVEAKEGVYWDIQFDKFSPLGDGSFSLDISTVQSIPLQGNVKKSVAFSADQMEEFIKNLSSNAGKSFFTHRAKNGTEEVELKFTAV